MRRVRVCLSRATSNWNLHKAVRTAKSVKLTHMVPHRSKMVGGVALFFLILTLLFDQASMIGGWIYKWQTLLGGIFAIFAAYVTISQMQESEKNQGQRHQEMMQRQIENESYQSARHQDMISMQLRPESIKIRRNFSPILREMTAYHEMLSSSLNICLSEHIVAKNLLLNREEIQYPNDIELRIRIMTFERSLARMDILVGNVLRVFPREIIEFLSDIVDPVVMERQRFMGLQAYEVQLDIGELLEILCRDKYFEPLDVEVNCFDEPMLRLEADVTELRSRMRSVMEDFQTLVDTYSQYDLKMISKQGENDKTQKHDPSL